MMPSGMVVRGYRKGNKKNSMVYVRIIILEKGSVKRLDHEILSQLEASKHDKREIAETL